MTFLTNEQIQLIESWMQEMYDKGYLTGLNEALKHPDSAPTAEPVYPIHNCIPDLSSFQKNINFDELCNGSDFIILRARYCNKTDSTFEERAKQMNEHNMPFAVYDYAMLRSHAHAKEQAENFYNLCAPYNPRIYYIDTEQLSSYATYATEMEYIKTYVARLRELGVEVVGQYTGDWLYSTYYKKLQDYFDTLWIASYGKDTGKDEGVALKSAEFTDKIDLHQFTSKGVIPGVPTKGDLSSLTGHRPLSWFTGRVYE